MLERDRYDSFAQLINSGIGPRPIDRILKLALRQTGCSTAAVCVFRNHRQHIIASAGLPYSFAPDCVITDKLKNALEFPFVCRDIRRNPLLQTHVLAVRLPASEFLASVSIEFPFDDCKAFLVLCSRGAVSSSDEEILRELAVLAEVISDEIALLSELAEEFWIRRKLPEIADVAESVSASQMNMVLVSEERQVIACSFRVEHQNNAQHDILRSIYNSKKFLNFLDRWIFGQANGRESIQFDISSSESVRLHGIEYNMQEGRYLLVFADFVLISSILSDYPEPDLVSAKVLAQFLDDTLIKQTQVKTRSGVSYHTLCRWRKPIRDAQISALRAGKAQLGASLIELASKQIIDGAHTLFGLDAFDKVTHVACGHSGADCFSKKVAIAVSRQLNKEFEQIFHPLAMQGSSHPKTNAGRPRQQFLANPAGRYLLVDDVATSGSHIVEATTLMRKQNAIVTPLAWLSS